MKRKTDFAILGILTRGPQSGYDIKKHISHSIGYFWQESYGQLYPTLKSLVDKGYATMMKEKSDGKPDRKVYQITKSGKQYLKEWLAEPVKSLPKLRNEFLLKLFFGNEVDPSVSISHLENYKSQCENYLEILKIVQVEIKNGPVKQEQTYWLITVSNGLHFLSSLIKWCNESIDILKKELK